MDIYFIKNSLGDIKIGKAENVSKRLAQLQTGNSEKLICIGIIKNVSDCFEKHLHIIFKKYRKEGEWFRTEIIDQLNKIYPIKKLFIGVRY